MKFYKGKFRPKNPKKYKGDPTGIIYRSSWEARLMRYLDENINVLEWGSEEIVIPYVSPVDNRTHRYFPDFFVKIKKQDGTTQTVILEVKPAAQTKEPEPQSRRTKKYITEVVAWGVNQAKWKAATEYCADRKWEFKLITENDIFGNKNTT